MEYVEIKFDGFDWDRGNIAKIQNRIPIEVIEELFNQRLIIKEDNRHSLTEDRYIAMGISSDKRLIIIAYTIRVKEGKNFIRVIPARYTHKKEKDAYEEIKKNF